MAKREPHGSWKNLCPFEQTNPLEDTVRSQHQTQRGKCLSISTMTTDFEDFLHPL